MAKKKEPIGWFTMNGRHVPLYEGESKADAIARATKESVKKQQENIKKNEDQKEKDLTKNKKDKNTAEKKTNKYNVDPETGEVIRNEKSIKDMTTDEFVKDLEKNGIEVSSANDVEKTGIEEDKEIVDYMKKEGVDVIVNDGARFWYFKDKESMKEYFENGGKLDYKDHGAILGNRSKKNEGSLSDSSAGKASDEARVVDKDSDRIKTISSDVSEQMKKYGLAKITLAETSGKSSTGYGAKAENPIDKAFEKKLQTWAKENGYLVNFQTESKTARSNSRTYKYGRSHETTQTKKRIMNVHKVPESFAKNYPSLSGSQLLAKYEEYLKKNRK